QYLTNVNGTLFFSADDGVHGIELWKSDGTAGGTVMVKDINPNTGAYFTGYPKRGNSNPRNLIDFDGTLYFAARDSNGLELWKSDGSEAGTVRVRDIFAGASYYELTPFSLDLLGNSSAPANLTIASNGTLLFSATDGIHGTELWLSD